MPLPPRPKIENSTKSIDTVCEVPADQNQVEKCCVCEKAPVQEVIASCGCYYCLRCFQVTCTAGSRRTRVCWNDNCALLTDYYSYIKWGTIRQEHKFTISEMERVLDHAAFEKMLAQRVEQFVRENARYLQYCPKPDCTQVLQRRYEYHEEEQGRRDWLSSLNITENIIRFAICSICSSTICLCCEAIHEGLACDKYLKKLEEAEAENELSGWDGIRHCLICSQACEKVDRCPDVECPVCEEYFDWECARDVLTVVEEEEDKA